jgi:hypothetical protein
VRITVSIVDDRAALRHSEFEKVEIPNFGRYRKCIVSKMIGCIDFGAFVFDEMRYPNGVMQWPFDFANRGN